MGGVSSKTTMAVSGFRCDDKPKRQSGKVKAVIEFQGLSDVVSNQFDKLSDRLRAVLPDKDMVEQGLVDFSLLSKVVTDQLPSLTSSFQNAISVGNVITSVIREIVEICVCMLVLFVCYRAGINFNLIMKVMALIFMTFSIFKTIKPCIDHILGKKIFQGAVDSILYSEYFTAMGKIFFCGFFLLICKTLPGKHTIDELFSRIALWPKAIDGMGKIMDYIDPFWNHIVDELKVVVLQKERSDLSSGMSLRSEVLQWAEDIQKYLKMKERNELLTDSATAAKIEQLYLQSQRLNVQRHLMVGEVLSTLLTFYPLISKLYTIVCASPVVGGGPRIAPATFLFSGDSGVGKSKLFYPLSMVALNALGYNDPDSYKDQVYARQAETVFWDGYYNQKIVVYDDAFQQKDDATKPNLEWFESVRAVNDFPCHLHKAVLEEKNTYLKANTIFYSTNVSNLESACKSLMCPEAVTRRVAQHCFRLSIKEQYRKRNGQLDVSRAKWILREMTPKERKDPNFDYLKLRLREENCKHQKKDGFCVPNNLGTPYAINSDVWLFKKLNIEAGLVAGDYQSFVSPSGNEFYTWQEVKSLVADTVQAQQEHSQGYLQYLSAYSRLSMKEKIEIQGGDVFETPDDFSDYEERLQSLLDSGVPLEVALIRLLSEDEYNDRALRFFKWRNPIKRQESLVVKTRRCLVMLRKYISECEEKIKMFLENHPWFKLFGIISLLLGSLSMAYKLLGFLKPDRTCHKCEGEFGRRHQCEAINSGDVSTKNRKKTRVESETRVLPMRKKDDSVLIGKHYPVEFQGTLDELSLTTAHHVVIPNTYRVSIQLEDRDVILGNAVFIAGYVLMMPNHFLLLARQRGLLDNGLLLLSQPGRPNIIKLALGQVEKNSVQLRDSSGGLRDIRLINTHGMVSHIHSDKVLRKHLISKRELGKIENDRFNATLVTMSSSSTGEHFYYLKSIVNVVSHSADKEIEIVMGTETFKQREYYSYVGETQRGDCGGLIIAVCPQLQRKILGMHFAGDIGHSVGYSVSVTQEDVLSALKNFPPIAQASFDLPPLIGSGDCIVPKGNFVPLGVSEVKITGAMETSLRQSSIHGLVSVPNTAPSILKPILVGGELVDPLLKGLEKVGKEIEVIPDDLLEIAKADILNIMLDNRANVFKANHLRILSFEEAVRGTSDMYQKPICRTTSPGFGWSRLSGRAGKQTWLGVDEYDFSSQASLELQQRVCFLREQCLLNVYPDVVWVDTLKDERRPLDRVRVGKTRVFSAGQMDFVILFRQYFLGFASYIMHNKIYNEQCLGINPYSSDWDILTREMVSCGDYILAGDFSNYDGSLNTQILWKILDIVNAWYDDGEENKQIRSMLWMCLVNSVHVFSDNAYMWSHGQPSGNPYTTIINSFVNSFLIRIVYLQKAPTSLRSLEFFRKCVRFVSYGDDNLIGVSATIHKWFNMSTISDGLAQLGFVYTDETKTGSNWDFRSITQVLFLKRGFRFEPVLGRWVAPLHIEVVYEMCNWVRKSIDKEQSTIDNIETAFREFALHGEGIFNEAVVRFRVVQRVLSRSPNIQTFGAYMWFFQYATYEELMEKFL